MADKQAQAAANELLRNPQFLELFQKAMGDAKDMPSDGDPNREAWLKQLQQKLSEETEKEAKKQVEQVHNDKDGQWMYILPQPGFCVKCFSRDKRKKIFINVCQHSKIAEPQPIEDAEEDDQIQFRIPLSCGPPRADNDKKGDPCVVYDVVVNPETIRKCNEEHEFRRFVAALCMQWIQQKNEPTLNVDEFTNVNIKSKGKPDTQRIRLGPAPGKNNANSSSNEPTSITDELKLPENKSGPTAPTPMGGGGASKGKLVMEVRPEPSHEVATEGSYDWSVHEKPTRNAYFREVVPKTIIVTATLPDVQTINEVSVELKGRHVEFTYVDEENGKPFYTINLNFPVKPDPERAKFVRKTQQLTLRLVVELPNEVLQEEDRAAQAKHDEDAEEAEEKAKERIRQEKLEQRRVKFERIENEEKKVMAERKNFVENLNAVSQGQLPPMLVKEIDTMPPEQMKNMLVRLENKVKRGDSIDQMLEKLPDDVLENICEYIRDKCGLESKRKERQKQREEEAAAAKKKKEAEAAAAGAGDEKKKDKPKEEEDGNIVEYDFSKKAENLFGVKMYNRYVFALEHWWEMVVELNDTR